MAIQAQLYSENLGFPWMENHGNCGFDESYFNLQQKQQQQQQLQHIQHVSALKNNTTITPNNNNNNNNSNNNNGRFLLQSIVEKQRQEIDRFISLQNESLRLMLQEQRKQELTRLVQKIEAKTLALLKQKDEEIAKAANRAMELENFLRKLEMENQAWQRVANENEAMVMSLNNTIEQLKESNAYGGDGGFFNYNAAAEDAESCCDLIMDNNNNDDEEEEAEENRATSDGIGIFYEEQSTRMLCKSCNSRNSCVLFLPCRHLCSCQACEPFLESCPVCKMVKKASIETLI